MINKKKLLSILISMISLMFMMSSVYAVQSAIDLGTAGDFVILSKAGISTTGTTSITGDIGVSPIGQTALTGFSKTTHSSNEYSTSDYIVGKLYSPDYLGATPSMLTTAISDMETAYTDAAGRTNPTATELGAGDISGMTITSGLYKWGTGLIVDSSGVTLSGGANDVWIFQIGEDLTVSNGAIITLSGGAQAKNIFWQVGGQTTLGTTSQFKGNILSKTLIEMNTGATLNGRALAQTAVTLDASTIVFPGTASSSTPPTSTTPSESEDSTETSDSADTESSSESVTSDSETTEIVTQNGETIKILPVDGKTKLNSGDVKVDTELSIEVEGNNIHTTKSNGVKSEIKIMPDAASEIALNRLRLKVCSEENNCTIELREVGKGEQTQIVYEFKIQRESRVFGLFKKQMKVSVQVNAQNGEIISIEKPWWAFLASEKNEGRN